MIGGLFSENTFWTVLALQSTIFIAVGLVGSLLLRRRAARAHQVLVLGMLAAVVVPALSLLVRHYELGIFTADSPRVSHEVQPSPARGEYETLGLVTFKQNMSLTETTGVTDEYLHRPIAQPAVAEQYSRPVAAESTNPRLPWGRLLAGAWIVASAVLLGRLLLTFVRGVRLLRRAQPVESARILQAVLSATQRLAVGRDVQIRHSDKVRSPVIWCWASSPVLLVQDEPDRLGENVDWIGLFCHELAHWKRLDHVSGLLAELMVCIVPWHLLAWWAKRRLMSLSEQACDDWVVACGQAGTDYADSLLDLSPEGQLAFLPTVVGKEKGLQTRIRRIVKEGCGNPRIGMRWALVASVVAMCAAVTVAFAQERPAEVREREELLADQEAREREEIEAAEIVGEIPVMARNFEASPEARELAERRGVLAQELRELERLVHETELELEEIGNNDADGARALRSELEALRDHVQTVRRELRGFDHDRPMAREWPVREGGRGPEAEERAHELMRHLQELKEQAHDTERELEKMRDAENPETHRIRAELGEIHEQIRAVEQELHRLENDPPSRARSYLALGDVDVETRARELMRHREELQEQARNTEQSIAMMSRGAEAMIMLPQLREIYEQLREVDRELHELEWAERAGRRAQRREPRERDEAAARAQDLMRHRARLEDEAREVEAGLRRLEQQGRARSEEAEELRGRLHEIRAEIEGTEREFRRFEREQRVRRDPRPEPGRRELENRRQRLMDGHLRELMRKREELRARASHIEPLLDALDEQDDGAKELQRQLRDIHENIEAVERQIHDIEQERAELEPARRREGEVQMDERMARRKELAEQARETELVLRKLAEQGDEQGDEARQLRAELDHFLEQMRAIEQELHGAERDRPREQGGLEHEVQQLRGQVGELRQEMGELRRLLEELLHREYRQPEESEHQETQQTKEVF